MKRVVIETVCSVIFYVLMAMVVSSTVQTIKEVEEVFASSVPDDVEGKTVEAHAMEMAIGLNGFQLETVQEVTDHETGQTESETFEITMNPIPWLLLFVFTIPWLIYSYKTRDRSKPFSAFATSMTEFQESDEREIQITRSATRASYKSVGIAVPFLIAAMIVYPFLLDHMPGYPVYLLAGAIIIPTLVYGIVWIKEYRK